MADITFHGEAEQSTSFTWKTFGDELVFNRVDLEVESPEFPPTTAQQGFGSSP